jgi:uncharacterized membrane protein (DUF485 family)
MISIDIPIKDNKNPPALAFPNRCVNCAKPKEIMLGITLNMGVQKRGQTVVMKLNAPMCNVCAKKERSIAMVTLIPFLISGLVIGLIVFFPVTLLAPEGTSSQTLGFPFVLGGFVGLIAGIIAGTVVEFFVKMLAIPFYGKLVTRRPLTVISLFAESDELVGISAKFSRETKTVQLTFENDDIAREFEKMNPREK